MKMKMNLSMSRQATKRTCYALISLLLVASLAFVVSSINVKNGMGNTNTMPEDEKDVKRKLTGEDDELPYSRNYVVVTKAVDFVRLFPNGGNIATYFDDFVSLFNSATDRSKVNAEFQIQGSSTTQKGAVYASSSIEVVNAPDGVEVEVLPNVFRKYQYAGNRKIKFTPVDDPFFFLHGQCVATSGFLEPSTEITTSTQAGLNAIPQPVIKSQSCRLNLCLGGGGFSCIAIYSGSAFVFNFGKGVALNNAAKTGTIPVTSEAPPLPPPFPGTIIGGTGAFEGIKGSVSIATIAGTTGPILFTDGTGSTFDRTTPVGSIVQVILVKSNMPLPPGP